jgi:hypothetical protein
MPYQQQTLAQLLAALEAGWDSAPFWTDAQGTRYINHALRLWNLLTGMWRQKVLISTVAGAHYVALPGTLTYSATVVWGETAEPLALSALFDLDCMRLRWEEETTASGGDVPTAPVVWAPSGLTEFGIWPADASGGRPLLVDGIALTPQLSAPTDFVDIGSQDATANVKLALHIASFTRGIAAVKSTQSYLREFVQAAMDQNERLRNSSYFRKYAGLDFEKGLRPMLNTTPAGQPGAPDAAGAGGAAQ